MKKLLISNDIQLNPKKYKELITAIKSKFPNYTIQEVSIKNLNKPEYLKSIDNIDIIVVLFAGYNLKRYWNNLVKHLLFSRQTLYGINIESHFFNIPRFKTFLILLKYKVKISFLNFFAKALF
ncbi:MAG: hypothetical protein COB02_00180 [Candidatus Cloacimonadota bacterium]|nr:MAG: hypothetical protein COB02_04315 [Candidatus Cloacimonadota bacterium]PCJ21040.1 MAG: hypothetical protein COB02_00180 [Candidatus Cloacimonadota bacterium]